MLRKPLAQALALWFLYRVALMAVDIASLRAWEAWALASSLYLAVSIGVSFACLRIVGASKLWALAGAGLDWALAGYVPNEGLILPGLILLTAGYLWIRRRLARALPAATEPAARPR